MYYGDKRGDPDRRVTAKDVHVNYDGKRVDTCDYNVGIIWIINLHTLQFIGLGLDDGQLIPRLQHGCNTLLSAKLLAGKAFVDIAEQASGGKGACAAKGFAVGFVQLADFDFSWAQAPCSALMRIHLRLTEGCSNLTDQHNPRASLPRCIVEHKFLLRGETWSWLRVLPQGQLLLHDTPQASTRGRHLGLS